MLIQQIIQELQGIPDEFVSCFLKSHIAAKTNVRLSSVRSVTLGDRKKGNQLLMITPAFLLKSLIRMGDS